ncbi:MAG TPA: hypothetical protein VGD81_16360 [Opitutaceae bacterium]
MSTFPAMSFLERLFLLVTACLVSVMLATHGIRHHAISISGAIQAGLIMAPALLTSFSLHLCREKTWFRRVALVCWGVSLALATVLAVLSSVGHWGFGLVLVGLLDTWLAVSLALALAAMVLAYGKPFSRSLDPAARARADRAKLPIVGTAIAVVGVLFWPVVTPVAGEIRIQLLDQQGEPMVGRQVHQHWSVYGFDDIGGTRVDRTDGSGIVELPRCTALGFLGLRRLRFVMAARTTSADMWIPIVHIDIDLPPGRWVPLDQMTAEFEEARLSLGRPWVASVWNSNPVHPKIRISGYLKEFPGNSSLVIRLRLATASESKAIGDYYRRVYPGIE